MIDPMGKLLAELRANGPLTAETAGHVWAGELPDRFQGATPSTDPRPYVLLHHLGNRRGRHNPVGYFRVQVTSVGKSPRLATKLYGLVSDVLHDAGPRYASGGTAVYRSEEEIGGQPANDPVTGWPVEISIYEVWAATLSVPQI